MAYEKDAFCDGGHFATKPGPIYWRYWNLQEGRVTPMNINLTSKTMQTGLTRVFARFGRKIRQHGPAEEMRQEIRGHGNDTGSRGL
jgi:hypothetical protein